MAVYMIRLALEIDPIYFFSPLGQHSHMDAWVIRSTHLLEVILPEFYSMLQ